MKSSNNEEDGIPTHYLLTPSEVSNIVSWPIELLAKRIPWNFQTTIGRPLQTDSKAPLLNTYACH